MMTAAEVFHLILMVVLVAGLVFGGIYIARNDTARRDRDQ